MLAKTLSASVIGIDAFLVEVEVNAPGTGDQTLVSIVGMGDQAVQESRDRIKSALHSTGLRHPKGNVVVNLAPADLRKEGAAFDLPIAIGLLAADGTVKREVLAKTAILGELALDGQVRPVRGVLPISATLQKMPQVKALLVPAANAAEAALGAGNLPVYAIKHLIDAVKYFNDPQSLSPCHAQRSDAWNQVDDQIDFAEVKGQFLGRRAMEIAAAGGHNSLLIGPPGTGKSMLAMRLPTILAPLTLDESLETSRVYSVLGLLHNQALLTQRPFRSPHHTISDIALIGGGRDPRPGEISLANNGVLFMDELPEFKRNVLEVLRQPLENGEITISRASGQCTFPSHFILVAAMNPCPCGRGAVELGCTCKYEEKRRYLKKVSGPLLDRIDLQVPVQNLSQDELLAAPCGENSATIRQRVIAARQIQSGRFAGRSFCTNSGMNSKDLLKYCVIDARSQALLRQAISRFKLSPRAYDRILKVSRTIADLGNSENIQELHVLEAINFRANFLEQL